MFGLCAILCALFLLSNVSAARDYEYNVATNCREFPRTGVRDPVTCSKVTQVDDKLFNPLLMTQGACPPPWVGPFEDRCYLFENNAKTAAAAEADCQKKGGSLANVNSRAEDLFIKDQNRPESLIGGALVAGNWVWSKDDSVAPFNNAAAGTAWNPWNAAPGAGTQMTTEATGWKAADPTVAKPYICERRNTDKDAPGHCRWDAYMANVDISKACVCPATESTCSKRGQCYWYKDPNSPFQECISQSERFYNMLHRLLIRRGKKDFAIKIRYGATPARGKLPLGPWGPAIIGHGHAQSMMGRPMGGMGGGMMGHPAGGMMGGGYGGMMGGGFGGMMGGGYGGMMGGGYGHGGGMIGGFNNYGPRRW